MLSMLLILACTNAGAGGKTSNGETSPGVPSTTVPEPGVPTDEVPSSVTRLRFVAESLTTPDHSEPFSTEARIDETAETIETITVFIPESTDAMSVKLSVHLPMGYTLKFIDTDGTAHVYSDQDTPIPLTVDLSDPVRFAVTQAGNPEKIYMASAFEGIPLFDEDDLRGIPAIENAMQKNYFLMNDIALTSDFEPLGSTTTPFTRIFDGRGKTISNLKIVQPGEDDVGFFKVIDSSSNTPGGVQNLILALADSSETSPSIEGGDHVGAIAGQSYGTIKNVAVTGGIVKGTARVGGLVGNQAGGKIENSYTEGRVEGTDYVGGLVGQQNAGKIENSHTKGHVEGIESVGGLVGYQVGGIVNSLAEGDVEGAKFVGGLVGQQDAGNIESSRATGDVTGKITSNGSNSQFVGGLVGYQNGGNIKNSYATGDVNGPNTLGGLVGWLQNGKIKNSYATGDVEGTASLGGLLGWQTAGTIENSYATGAVMGDSNIGGLVGRYVTGTIISSYFDAILTRPDGQTTLLLGVGGRPNIPGVTPFYTVDSVVRKDNNETADAVTRDDFVGWNFIEGPAENNGDPIWHLPENGHWPILYWQNQ